MTVVKDVFAAEEFETSVSSEDFRRLQENSTAVDVRNAVFVWPYGRHSDANAGDAGWITCACTCTTKYIAYEFTFNDGCYA